MLTVFLSACNGRKEKIVPVETGELQPITLGVMPTLEGFPFVIAQKQGIYDSLGLDVSFIHFNSAADRDAAFIAERMDGMITDYPSAALLQTHHPKLALIMKNDGYFCFIVGQKSGISQLKQLKQKNIAISQGTVINYATDLLLEKAGISPSDNNLPEIGQIPLRLNMIQYAQIDATFLPDPFATIAMKDGHKSLISTLELGINLTGTAFSEKAIKEKKREIALLIEGYNEGVRYIQMHPQSELTALLAEATGIPENLAGLIALPTYTIALRPSNISIDKTLKWLKDKGWIPDTYQGSNLVDTTFAAPNNNKY